MPIFFDFSAQIRVGWFWEGVHNSGYAPLGMDAPMTDWMQSTLSTRLRSQFGMPETSTGQSFTGSIRKQKKEKAMKPTRTRAGATKRNESRRSLRSNCALSLRRAAITVSLAAGLFLAGSSSVHALAYTIAAPLAITVSEVGNVNGVVGTLLPLGLPSTLAGTISLSTGDTSFVANDVIVFALSLSAGSAPVDAIGLGTLSNPVLPNPMGAGAFAEGGTELPDSISVGSFTTLLAAFSYATNTLTEGETTRNLFVTYSPAGTALAEGNTVNFSISSGTNFTVQSTLVPEPGTALLVGSGLALLALRRKEAL